MKIIIILLSIFLIPVFSFAAATWVYPNQSYMLPLDSSKYIRYIEAEWTDNGGNASGTLYLNGISMGAKDIGNGSLSGNYILPDIKTWFGLNRVAYSGYFYIQNDVAQIYNYRILYFDPNNPPTSQGTYSSGQSIIIPIVNSRLLKYIEVDWINSGFYTTGTLYINGYSYGSQAVGGSANVNGYIFPSIARWNINGYVSSAYITISGGAAYYYGYRIIYAGDSGYSNPTPYPHPSTPGPFPSPVGNTNPVQAGPAPTSGPHIPH